MNHVKLGTVIAERVLSSSKLANPVQIRIGIPRESGQGDFITPYQITGVGTEQVRFAAGLDSLQSLQLALRMIGADVNHGLQRYQLHWADGADPGL